jgi:hypothetical protein
MPKMYVRECNYCGKLYRGRGTRFCSASCGLEFSRGNTSEVKVDLVVSPPEATDVLTWRKYFENLNRLENTNKKHLPVVTEASTSIFAEKNPVTVIFSACWHIGSRGTDYTELRKLIDYIVTTEGVYLGLLGDEIDNFFAFGTQEAVAQQIIHPAVQRQLLKNIVDDLTAEGKLLFSVYSNHTIEREEKLLGYSPTKELFKNTIFFDSKGSLDLFIADTVYKLFILHQTKTSSVDNPCLGMKNELKRYSCYDRYDVVASAHHHYPYVSVEFVPEKTIFLKAGTYKTHDLYAERHWKGGIIGSPAIVFYPKSRRAVPFLSAWDALIYTRGGVDV